LAGLSAACSESGGRETGISVSGENQTIISKLVYLLNVLLKIHKYCSNSGKNQAVERTYPALSKFLVKLMQLL